MRKVTENTLGPLCFVGPKIRAKALPARRFWELREHELPASPGVYIFSSKPSTRFRYPEGCSRVFYIGRSENFRTRLRATLQSAEGLGYEKKTGRRERYLFPQVLQYVSAFAYEYVVIATWKKMNLRGLENIVLAQFVRDHDALPVANGKGKWDSLLYLTARP